MPIFISPDGNFEVWNEKPVGYFTIEEWQAKHPMPVLPVLSNAQLFDNLRHLRDIRLNSTDKMLLADYPISAEKLEEIKAYRQILRDLPAQPGAPWDGGGELTPWPELPDF